MSYHIVPISEAHITGFHGAFDRVARELRYLGRTKAPPLEETTAWVHGNLKRGVPQFVALVDESVVGWCDVSPTPADTMAHSGVLGMGIVDGHRGQGIGGALLRTTLPAAMAFGLTRVELTVREDNTRARMLYVKHGFEIEGVKRNAALIDGKYYNLWSMALLFERSSAS
jgi:RimJ/RimL family protein N-acetyltransferase